MLEEYGAIIAVVVLLLVIIAAFSYALEVVTV
jgi:hypothetical protein